MSCRSFQIVLMQVARGEVVDDEARKGALAHTHACGACSSELARSQVLTEALTALAAANRAVETPAPIGENLLRAFRSASTPSPRAKSLSRKTLRKVELAAAAAVVLAISLVGWRVVRKRSKASPAKAAGAVAYSARAKPQPVLSVAPPVTALRRHAPHAIARNSQAAVNRTEALRGFLPLPNTEVSGDQGTLAMVRIQLQPGALEALGITPAEESSSRPVTADVLIGNDGMAQAIRFDQ